MQVHINDSLIDKFSKKYNEDPNNKIIENAVTTAGICSVSLNREAVLRAKNIFSIELKQGKITDQKTSLRCWTFAGLNMIKSDIARNLNTDLRDFELSQNYLIFFDKLERANNAYENIIKLKDADISERELQYIMFYPVNEGGHWTMFVALVNKYGIVPKSIMPETFDSENSEQFRNIFSQKVKKDIIELRKMLIYILDFKYHF